jgi:hypothetical protein
MHVMLRALALAGIALIACGSDAPPEVTCENVCPGAKSGSDKPDWAYCVCPRIDGNAVYYYNATEPEAQCAIRRQEWAALVENGCRIVTLGRGDGAGLSAFGQDQERAVDLAR